MAWEIGNQKVKKWEDYNSIVKELKGELSEKQAKLVLAKFLKTNIGFTLEMIAGVSLLEVQEIILKAFFLRDIGILVAGRGFSKTFLISVFSILYSIFYERSGFCLLSANFRGSRRILEESEKIVNHKKAELLRQCFPNTLKRAADLYKWILPNGSEIFALPLSNGDGLRGTRAQCVCLDEARLINKDIQENVVRPFLSVKQNVREEMEIREIENTLIKDGIITEDDRMSFPRNKFFAFSSASYDFEYLHEMYQNYIDNTRNPSQEEKNPATYFAIRASYEVLEELPNNSILDMTQINAAKADGGEFTDYFKREWKAIFSNASDGYFNIKRMHECTVERGDYPTVQISGEKESKYILLIDPSYSSSKSSDYFAMAVYLLVPEERKIVLVHSYGKAGGDIADHFNYLVYILSYFNIVFISIDDSGSEFIHGFNESVIAKNVNINLKFLDCNFESDEYLQEVNKAKLDYNLLSRKIVYGQKFTSQSIRRMYENLKNKIEQKKIWFASKINADEETAKKYEAILEKFTIKNKNDKIFEIVDFIDDQNYWVDETKAQTALIQVKTTVLGTLQFDLPQNLRRSTDINRPRKDNHVCLLLAASAAVNYYDMMFTEVKKTQDFFKPIIIR